MAKIRVHELAKELGVDTKEVIAYLSSNGCEVKSASGVEDDMAAKVRGRFTPKPAAKEEIAEKRPEKPTAQTKSEMPSEEKKAVRPEDRTRRPRPEGERSADAPKKKKPQVLVFTQNSKNGKMVQVSGPDRHPRRPGDDKNRQGQQAARHGSQQMQGSEAHRPIRPRGDVHPSQRLSREEELARQEELKRAAALQEAAEIQAKAEKEKEQSALWTKPAEMPAAAQTEPAKAPETLRAPEEEKKAPADQTADKPQIRKPVVIARVDLTPKKPERSKTGKDGQNHRSADGRRNNDGRANRDNRDNRGNRDARGQGQAQGQGRDQSANRPRNGKNDPRDNRNGRPVKNGEGKLTTVVIDSNSEKQGKGSRKKVNTREKGDGYGKNQENYINLEKNGGKKRTKPTNAKPDRDLNEELTIVLPESLTVRELAEKMKVVPSDIVKKLFMQGKMLSINSEVDYETAEEIALEFNCVCEPEEKIDVIAELLKEDEEAEEDMISRSPVVCVMGHVDHGKTSLLDAIRDTRVTDREAGGITQHIGASVVPINGRSITFLDTPGHEAFTAMRMRGANSTDIAILVVAADDGVMPQTVEAINHAKAAGVEIIVAINKIDKPGANPEKVKQELTEYELVPTDWGGTTEFVEVSAKTRQGIPELLEIILLTADVLELKANPNRMARGLVIEAQLDKGRGVVATVLVQKGTLKVGDPVACGSSFGKVRAMLDDRGRRVKTAGPSTPVEILGLSEVPNAGETFMAFDTEKDARDFAATYVSENKKSLIEETKAKMSLDDLFSQIQAGSVKELNLIVKADVQGSVEAVKSSLLKLSNEEVVVKVIHGGVGDIKESDVILASASNAIIIGFNVKPDAVAKSTAEAEKIDIRLYNVIYNAIEDIELAMKGMLDPVYEEKIIGHGIVRQIFKASGVGNIAGSYVTSGMVQRGCKIRLMRRGDQIFDGNMASLKHFKDDVKEVKNGFECGIVLDGFSEVEVDDEFEAYVMVEVPR